MNIKFSMSKDSFQLMLFRYEKYIQIQYKMRLVSILTKRPIVNSNLLIGLN